MPRLVVVVHDRDERASVQQRRAPGRRAQRDSHHAIALHQRVVDDRHHERLVGDARREGQRPAGRDVIAPRLARAIHRRIIHRHQTLVAIGAEHADHRDSGVLQHRVIVGGKREPPIADLRVGDDQVGHPQTNRRAAADTREREPHTAVADRHVVVQNRNGESLRGLSVGEIELPADRPIVHPRHARTIRRRVKHGRRTGRAVRARDRDHRAPARFADREEIRGEAQHARTAVHVHNRQNRRRQTERRRVGRLRVEKRQVHGFVPLDHAVVDDRHRERLRRHIAVCPRERVGHPQIICARDGGAIRGDRLHRDRARAAPDAVDRDHRIRAILDHAEIRRRETQHAVVVHNRQRRGIHHAQRRARQREQHRATVVRHRVVAHGDREVGARLARGKREERVGAHKIRRRRRPVRRHNPHRHRAGEIPAPDDRHQTRAGIFADVVIRRAELEHPATTAKRAAIQPRQPIPRLAIDAGERAAHDDFAIEVLDQRRRDEVVRTRPKVDRGVERARHIEAHHAVGGHAIKVRESTAHKHPAICLQSQRAHVTVETRARTKRPVHRAKRRQLRQAAARHAAHRRKRAAHQDATRGPDRQRQHARVRARARIKRGIQRTIPIQPRQPRARRAVVGREITADENLAVGLNRDRPHQAIRARPRVEQRINRAIRIQARDEVARGAIHQREQSTNQHPAIRLQRERIHGVVRPDERVERGVQRAIRIQARDEIAIGSVDPREQTTDHHAAVRLHHERTHGVVGTAVGTAAGIEGQIHGPIQIQPRHPVGIRAVEHAEISPDHGLADQQRNGRVGVDAHRLHDRRAGADPKREVHRAILVELRNAVAQLPVHHAEIPRDDRAVRRAPARPRDRVGGNHGPRVIPKTKRPVFVHRHRHHRRGPRTKRHRK